MFKTRMLAHLLVSALGAIAVQPLVAGEPAVSAPPAKSISEWRTTASPAPAGTPPPAQSIREWRTTPSLTPGPCPTASPIAGVAVTPVANPPAKPAVSAATPTTPVTISFTSTLRQGNLVVILDDVPVFNEKFQKPLLIISQTTEWDPLQVPAGTHRLTAKVYGTKKTYFSKTYDLQLSRTKGAVLRFVMRGDKLTVALAS